MKNETRTPFAAVLAAELTMAAIIGSAGIWYAQEVAVRALQVVIGLMVG